MTRRISMLVALVLAASAAPTHAATPAFAPADTLVPAGTAAATAIADIDRDGRPDLIAGAAGRLTVHRARAAGGFTADGPYPIGSGPMRSIHVADLDRDGRQDLLVQTAYDVYLLRAEEGGGFHSSVVAWAPDDIAVADVTGDGAPDLVFGSIAPDRVLVGSLQADGTFAWSQHSARHTPRDVIAGDIDGDGHDELLAFNWGFRSMSLFPGTVSGLGPAWLWSYFELGTSPLIRDLNGDGRGDLAMIRNDHVIVQHGRTGPDLGPERWYSLGGNGTQLRAADLDGDGLLDLAALTSGGLAVFPGRPGGEFGPRTSHPLGAVYASSLSFGDLDGDGRPEAVTAEADGVRVHHNRTSPVTIEAPALHHGGPMTIRRAVTGFLPSLYFIRQFVKGPEDQAFRQLGRDIYPAGGGETVFDAWAGDGEYRFRAVAYGWDHEPLETVAPQEAVTRLETPKPPVPTPTPTPTATATPTPTVIPVPPRATPTPTPTPAPISAPPEAAAPEEAEEPSWDVRLAVDHRAGRKSTHLRVFRIENLPRDSTVTVTCRTGCARKTLRRQHVTGTLSLRSFATKPLKVGTKVTIKIVTLRRGTLTATLTIRARKAPKLTSKLVPAR